MFYCENCYLLNEGNTCAFCGSRLTRGPRPGDYCFVGNKWSPWAEMLHGILEDDHIPVIIRQWSPRTVAYTGEAGLKPVFLGVKTSVKGQYGLKSPHSRAISAIHW